MMTNAKSFLQTYLNSAGTEASKATLASLATLDFLIEKAPEVTQEIIKELQDQRRYLKMVASENYSSLEVQLAMGNWLTDKYAEGYAGHRFYAGCEQVDAIEKRANESLKTLYGAQHAYCQPHSGADANLIAYWSILVEKIQNKEVQKLGAKNYETLSFDERERIRQLLLSQKIMGMALDCGGHLTHGFVHNLSSKMMQAHSYGVDKKSYLIDYTELQKQAKEVKPLILVAGYSAYPRRLNFAKMREIADSVGAVLMVDMAHFSGLVAGGVMQGEENPIPYADIVTSTSHKTLRGPRGGFILCTNEYASIIDKGCPLVMGGPLPHVMAAKAIAFEQAAQPSFKAYARQIVLNAQALAEALKSHGARLLTQGTDNHLILMDTTSFGLNGKQAEDMLRFSGITLNRNTLPYDPLPPWLGSGIRMGTPALTSLGMKEEEMKRVAALVIEVLKHAKPSLLGSGKLSQSKAQLKEEHSQRVLKQVAELLKEFPLYPQIEIDNIH